MAEFRTIVTKEMTVKKVSGSATAHEIIRNIVNFYSIHPTLYMLWDLSEASLELLTSEDLRRIADIVQLYAHLRNGGKTAIVAPRDLEYWISKALLTKDNICDIPFEIEVFRKISDAEEWLGIDLSDTNPSMCN